MTAPPALAARDLVKRYRHRPVLDGVDVRLDPGTLTLLVGANGAGKTTLLRVLATLDAPDAGALTIAGVDAAADGARARAAIAWTGHRPGLWPALTVRENLDHHAAFHPHAGRDVRVDAALTRFALDALADARAGTLSRGQQQRAALARAFAQDARVILMDEPWTGLDDEGRDRLAEAVRAACARGAAVLASTHDPALADGLAARVLRVADGRVTEVDAA